MSLKNKFAFNNDIKQNLQLAEELHKPIIKNFKTKTAYSGFIFRLAIVVSVC